MKADAVFAVSGSKWLWNELYMEEEEEIKFVSRRKMYLLLLNLVSGDISTHFGQEEVPHIPVLYKSPCSREKRLLQGFLGNRGSSFGKLIALMFCKFDDKILVKLRVV